MKTKKDDVIYVLTKREVGALCALGWFWRSPEDLGAKRVVLDSLVEAGLVTFIVTQGKRLYKLDDKAINHPR